MMGCEVVEVVKSVLSTSHKLLGLRRLEMTGIEKDA